MCSIFMIVADVVRKQPLQMLLVDRDYVIKQVPATTLDPALGDAILPGTLVGRLNRIDPHRSYRDGNFQPVFCVSVKDQESGNGVEREGLSQLLHDPHARGMLGDIEMQNLPSIVADDEEAVKHAKCDCRNREEIHRGDRFSMIAKEREPAFSRFRISWRLSHPTGNGSLRHLEAEHEKFAMNA